MLNRHASKNGVLTGTVLAFAVTAGGGPSNAEPAVAKADGTVRMSTFLKFGPKEVTIQVGGAVEWRNASIEPHTVTDDPSKARDAAHAQLPEGAQAFDSGLLKPGQTYRHVFTVPGLYQYFCAFHEKHGMVATVVVTP